MLGTRRRWMRKRGDGGNSMIGERSGMTCELMET